MAPLVDCALVVATVHKGRFSLRPVQKVPSTTRRVGRPLMNVNPAQQGFIVRGRPRREPQICAILAISAMGLPLHPPNLPLPRDTTRPWDPLPPLPALRVSMPLMPPWAAVWSAQMGLCAPSKPQWIPPLAWEASTVLEAHSASIAATLGTTVPPLGPRTPPPVCPAPQATIVRRQARLQCRAPALLAMSAPTELSSPIPRVPVTFPTDRVPLDTSVLRPPLRRSLAQPAPTTPECPCRRSQSVKSVLPGSTALRHPPCQMGTVRLATFVWATPQWPTPRMASPGTFVLQGLSAPLDRRTLASALRVPTNPTPEWVAVCLAQQVSSVQRALSLPRTVQWAVSVRKVPLQTSQSALLAPTTTRRTCNRSHSARCVREDFRALCLACQPPTLCALLGISAPWVHSTMLEESLPPAGWVAFAPLVTSVPPRRRHHIHALRGPTATNFVLPRWRSVSHAPLATIVAPMG